MKIKLEIQLTKLKKLSNQIKFEKIKYIYIYFIKFILLVIVLMFIIF